MILTIWFTGLPNMPLFSPFDWTVPCAPMAPSPVGLTTTPTTSPKVPPPVELNLPMSEARGFTATFGKFKNIALYGKIKHFPGYTQDILT
jgi:hypothetical protein